MSVKIVNYNTHDAELPVMVINLKHRSIISIPTQIGCAIGCTFCLSSEVEFNRNLTAQEMIDLIELGLQHASHATALISFTGEGEPFLNLKHINETMKQLHTRNEIEAFRLCTSGIKPNLFSQVAIYSKPVNIQLSLHSPNDGMRKTIIPKSKPLDSIVSALKDATARFNEIAVNYVLMEGINDSENDRETLAKIVDPRWVVKFNPLLDDEKYKSSDQTPYFLFTLLNAGIKAIAFSNVGSKISNGLYGQLTYAKNNRIA